MTSGEMINRPLVCVCTKSKMQNSIAKGLNISECLILKKGGET